MNATSRVIKNQILIKKVAFTISIFLFGISQTIAATITSSAQGGLWGEKSTWIGGIVPTKTDDVIITSEVKTGDFYYSSGQYDMANLTIQVGGKIIRESAAVGRCLLNISGNLINNGEILDFKDFFDINVYGNLQNNGVFKPRLLYLLGQNQQISGNKPISPKTLNLQMTDSQLTAASDLHFHNCDVNGNTGKILNMKNFKLKLSADSITYSAYYGTVYSACEVRVPLHFEQTGTIEIDKALIGKTIQGDVLLKSPTYAFLKDLTVEGNFTIEKGTKASSYANSVKLNIKGNFTNYGNLNTDSVRISNLKFPPRSLYLTIYGNSFNFGNTGISKIFMTTNGNERTIKGTYAGDVKFQQAEGNETPGGKVFINDEVEINGKMEVYTTVEIKPDGKLNLRNRTSSPLYIREGQGQLINNGSMYRYHYVNSSWFYYHSYANQPGTFVDYDLREWEGTFDGMDIEVHNGTTYPGLTGSTLRWWRLKSVGEGKIKYYTIKFYYDESLLNGQKEENLKVFRTTDKGQTWEPVSVREGAVLDTVNNFISIGSWSKNTTMLTEFGDFVISAGDGTVPLESNIKVDMIGRPDVRLGAPNPFSIHVYNITNQRTNPILLAMDLGEDVRFKEVRLPYNDGVEILPIDSIGDSKDQTQVFFIPYLEPNEHYTFDVIVYGVPEHLKSTNENMVTLTLGGFFGHVAEDEAVDFVVEKVGEAVDLDQKEKEEYARGLGLTVNQLKTEKQQYGKTVTTIRHLSKYTVKKIADTNPVTKVLFKVGEGVEGVSKIKDSLRRRLFHWFYKEVGLYGVEEKVASGKKVEGKLVASWDPNEIVGPAGYGEQNHLSEIPTMNYTIFFENKKEATAPAYRVQIVDTLSAAFNPETVKFGETSHMGAQYNWKMEREGNILKWDIEGIELMPNITPPEGEGFVKFSVELNNNLPTGTAIENRATITFDMNPPIVTNTWVNILDFVAPTTTMNTIEYQAGDTILIVTCTATDNESGAGVGMYEFFASVDQSPFVSVGQSAQNSIEFQIPDSTKNNYRFYALVTDNVGNAEQTIPQLTECNSLLVSAKTFTNPVSKLSMYPNPVKDFVNIQLKEPTQKAYIIEIVSINGARQHSALYTDDQMQQGISIDTRHLRKGTYLLRIKSDQQVETQKLIIK